jgi:hypothetical protein
MTDKPIPKTEFDWAMYADATFAGLAILIPLPPLDAAFEFYFRTRMPRAIARRRGQTLTPEVVRIMNRAHGDGCLAGCLMAPLNGTVWLIKRLSRKILYFLTVKEASDKVSSYWHRAFLIDYMLLEGHAAQPETALIGRSAIEAVLGDITTSPLLQLANQVTRGVSHIWRTLRKARQGEEDEVVQETRAQMEQNWSSFSAYFIELARQYDQAYREIEQERLSRSLEVKA